MKRVSKIQNLGIIFIVFLSWVAVNAQNGIGDNFNNAPLSCGWAPNTYKLTEIGNELRVVCTVPGNAYNTFDLNFPAAINVSTNPVVTVRIRSTAAVSIRIDLKDASGAYTNATPT
ncbi:MAG: hypothetical protein K2Q22_11160, partial [Cytophagales bacterium]|nr:hypothetical protein [Cytophagales bacterium]